jgi:hypothetical protein
VGHATKRTLLLVGPDGAGKTSVLRHLLDRAAIEGVSVVHIHSRPGVIAGRASTEPVTEPHAEPPRPAILASAKVLMVLADNILGGLRWMLRRRRGLMVVERGWYDMAVDPRRYRLPRRVGCLTVWLGRLIPPADVVALLTADPEVIAARKAELPSAEIQRQIERWQHLLSRAGRRSVLIDTGHLTAQQCADAIWSALAAAEWRRVTPAPARLDLRATGRPRASLSVYRPQNRRAKIASVATRFNARMRRGESSPAPVEHLDELLSMLALAPTGIVAMRSSTAERWVLSVDSSEGGAVLKVGDADDRGLQNEADFLVTQRFSSAFRLPEVLWGGRWHDRFVVATRMVTSVGRAPIALDEVASICTALVRGDFGSGPVLHGDLAPWNIIRDGAGLVVLDWEFARSRTAPLWDLAHHVIQTGALVGVHPPSEALALLTGPGSVGRRHLADVGESSTDALTFLRVYVEEAQPHEARVHRYLDEIRRLTNGRTSA